MYQHQNNVFFYLEECTTLGERFCIIRGSAGFVGWHKRDPERGEKKKKKIHSFPVGLYDTTLHMKCTGNDRFTLPFRF